MLSAAELKAELKEGTQTQTQAPIPLFIVNCYSNCHHHLQSPTTRFHSNSTDSSGFCEYQCIAIAPGSPKRCCCEQATATKCKYNRSSVI